MTAHVSIVNPPRALTAGQVEDTVRSEVEGLDELTVSVIDTTAYDQSKIEFQFFPVSVTEDEVRSRLADFGLEFDEVRVEFGGYKFVEGTGIVPVNGDHSNGGTKIPVEYRGGDPGDHVTHVHGGQGSVELVEQEQQRQQQNSGQDGWTRVVNKLDEILVVLQKRRW